MKTDNNDYKQIAFKLQSDIDFKMWEKSEKDLSFLKEMKLHAVKAFDDNDVVSREMLMIMIEDWIDELERKNNEL